MMSQSYMDEIAAERAAEAEEEGLVPLRAKEILVYFEATGRFNIPFLGTYVPTGWIRDDNIQPLFVDSSGFGAEDEPALTISQFVKRLETFAKSTDPYGFGILEAGQFQLYIGVYRVDPRDFTHTGKLTEKEMQQVGGKR